MSSETFNRVFLLVGKTGNGKSATGNSILGYSEFTCSDDSISMTSDISFSSAVRLGYTITVVDAPGVMDTRVNSTEAKWKSCKEMIHAMSICPTSGKLAILVVLKYGVRSTQENRETIQILSKIFGEENLWKSCIIVFTHGDLFDINYEGEKLFKDWLKEQSGDLGKIIESCGFKCVLFYNKVKSVVKNEEQLKPLMGFVDQLDQGFTAAKFEEAKKQQKRLELEARLPRLEVEFQSEINSLLEKMNATVITSESSNEIAGLENWADQLLAQVNKTDDPEIIFYDPGEARLLEEIRTEVEDIYPKIILMKDTVHMMRKAESLILCINKLLNDINNVNPKDEMITSVLKHIESNAEELWSRVAQEELWSRVAQDELSPPILIRLDASISLAKQKLSALAKEVVLAEKSEELNLKIDELQDEVTNKKIPTLVSTFADYTERADQILSELNADTLEVHDKDHLIERVTDLKTQIYNLKIDNDMNIGWTSTSVITGVISAFTAFIPVVGIPISVGLNVAPVVGHAIHRTVERSRRQAKAAKDKNK